ncbi:MAG: hypothetical protein J4469_01355 [Candidatus Aenigmarchaeota archaeon]|nr:hypothetical protein [Candidatus Aenigmarchaeota archaeon]
MNRTAYLIFALSVVASVAAAHEEMQTPEEMMNVIVARQGVSSIGDVDCGSVLEVDFEMLGDAVMGRMAGSHELHEQMDSMMGGEGSAGLQSAHIAMGKNWLGCSQGTMGSEMMNANMMPMMMRMMGNYYPAYYSGYDAVLLLAVAGWVLFFAMLYLYLSRVSRKTHRR